MRIAETACLVPRRFRIRYYTRGFCVGARGGEKRKIRREAPGRIYIQDGGLAMRRICK